MNSFHIFTYGCQMNKNDSEQMAGLLEEAGYQSSDDPDASDVLIFNTCAVRGNAEQRAFGRLREFAGKRRKQRRSQKLVISGCVPQYERDKLFENYPFIDFIVGPNTFQYLPAMLARDGQQKIQIEEKKQPRKQTTIHRESRDQAWVPIMYGCDNFCSYCIVPYTRGREVSRPKEDVFMEIEDLRKTSFRKICLLGQNVNSYGRGLYEDYDFSDLLQDLHQFEWLERIDFLTSHPKDMSDKLMAVIKNCPRIGRELHFPLQAGSDRILKRMNRGYTLQEYKEKVRKIRELIPNAMISTDLIVGFPGETEEDFETTVQALYELRFYRVNSASFSPRKGTGAAEMADQVPDEEKHRRLLRLQEVIKQTAFGR